MYIIIGRNNLDICLDVATVLNILNTFWDSPYLFFFILSFFLFIFYFIFVLFRYSPEVLELLSVYSESLLAFYNLNN